MHYFDIEVKVRYAETDRMGIAHHSNYPIWFEVGRTEYIKKIGISYSDIEARGLLLPLLELKCNYISSSTYEDVLIIRTRVRGYSKTRLSFYYEVFKKDNMDKPIATGETAHAWTNKELKPVNLQKFFPELYDTILSVPMYLL